MQNVMYPSHTHTQPNHEYVPVEKSSASITCRGHSKHKFHAGRVYDTQNCQKQKMVCTSVFYIHVYLFTEVVMKRGGMTLYCKSDWTKRFF
jgi:hypothetical protein